MTNSHVSHSIKVLLSTVAVSAISFPLSASAATLLSDDFNALTPRGGVLAGSFLDESFYVITGSVDVFGSGYLSQYNSTGNYIDLNGNSRGALTSTSSFTFAPGESATLSFLYGTNPNEGPNTADVFLGGVLIKTLSNTNLIGTALNPVTLNIANPVEGTLDFVSTTNSASGIIIDSVNLTSNGSNGSTSVPEPFTIIGTLVGGTAALRIRKKLKASAS